MKTCKYVFSCDRNAYSQSKESDNDATKMMVMVDGGHYNNGSLFRHHYTKLITSETAAATICQVSLSWGEDTKL